MIVNIAVLCLLVFGLDLARAQEIDTVNGRVRGQRIDILGKSVDVFLGIPFASPPIGLHRFKYPQPPVSWKPEVKDAITQKPSCIQDTFTFGSLSADDPARLTGALSEDCLYLNIWKPSSANNSSKKAVMVWFYGGAFSVGSINQPLYNGQYLAAENDVVVVTINYRLGLLGFGFLGPDTIPGNMGMMDQVEGLKWVQNNIENFGGDRNKVTLFGESAGAFSVGYHLASPLSRDLFNNAILQSGSPVSKVLPFLRSTTAEARENIKHLALIMNCSESSDKGLYDCLMSADPEAITVASRTLDVYGFTFVPVYDGYFLPKSPITLIETGQYKKTNILTGVTKDEYSVFLAFLVNVVDQTLYTTGEKFSSKHFESAIRSILAFSDTRKLKAMKTFYESEHSHPADYLVAASDAGSDIAFKCPALLLSSLFTESNDVYLYSLNYRVSNRPLPPWMGVPHFFELYLLFGLPLSNSPEYSDEDRELSRNMMKYWTNFAKSGNPNYPDQVGSSIWPVFNKENQTHMVLDVGSNLAPRDGFRRHQCAFVNDILPMIPKHERNVSASTPHPPCGYPSSGGRRQCPGCVYVILSLLTVFFWTLQG